MTKLYEMLTLHMALNSMEMYIAIAVFNSFKYAVIRCLLFFACSAHNMLHSELHCTASS